MPSCAIMWRRVQRRGRSMIKRGRPRSRDTGLVILGQEPSSNRPQYSQNKGGLGPNGARHEWGCCAPKHVNLVQQKVDVEPPADNAGNPPRRERSGHFQMAPISVQRRPRFWLVVVCVSAVDETDSKATRPSRCVPSGILLATDQVLEQPSPQLGAVEWWRE